jgi:hypothetical protein
MAAAIEGTQEEEGLGGEGVGGTRGGHRGMVARVASLYTGDMTTDRQGGIHVRVVYNSHPHARRRFCQRQQRLQSQSSLCPL